MVKWNIRYEYDWYEIFFSFSPLTSGNRSPSTIVVGADDIWFEEDWLLSFNLISTPKNQN